MGWQQKFNNDSLKQFSVDNVKIDDAWKGDNPNLVMSADSSAPLSQILADLLNTSDLVLLEVVGMCVEYKTQALRVKCSLSTKNGGPCVFLNCLETLALESYTGMPTARTPLHQSHCTSQVPCTKRLTVLLMQMLHIGLVSGKNQETSVMRMKCWKKCEMLAKLG